MKHSLSRTTLCLREEDTKTRVMMVKSCASYVLVLLAEIVLVAVEPAELLDELLPLLFCVTA